MNFILLNVKLWENSNGDYIMNYGEKIKNLREDNDIKQIEMAEMLGLKKNMYCMYENEYQVIPAKYLLQIANILNVSIDYIFGFTDEKNYINIKEFNIFISGQRIKELRKNYKLSQNKVADILNTSQSMVNYYEKGKNIISTLFLFSLCKRFSISADYLLGRIDEIPSWCLG